MKKIKTARFIVGSLAALLIFPSVVSAKTTTVKQLPENRYQLTLPSNTNQWNEKHHLLTNGSKQASIQSIKKIDHADINDNRIIVKLSGASQLDYSSLGVTPETTPEPLKEHGIQIVKVNSGINYDQTLSNIKKNPLVISAEPDYERQVKFLPTDPMISYQWYLDAIHLPEAWDISQGSNTVTVAVLDTGVNNHADLQGKLLPGYDFVNNDSDPSDDLGHGTHVAGIIAANANNGEGGVGVNFNTRILPIKVAGSDGIAPDSLIAEGIYYAMDHGANVINMSLGGPDYDSIVEQAVWDAYNAGIVLVAAAGNDGVSTPDYPASYAPVISVSATDQNNQLASFSNYGDMIDIAAPGVGIFGPENVSDYYEGDGTSFSSPIIAGIAALIKGMHPDWTPAQIEWAIEKGTDQTIGWNDLEGYGLVNAYQALSQTVDNSVDKVSDDPDQAGTIQYNTTVSEAVNMPMDMDFYRFKVDKTSKVSIQVSGVQNLDLVGELEKNDNGQWSDIQLIDDNGMGEGEQADVDLAPGDYAIGVYDYNNHWSNNPYQIQITTLPEESLSITDINGHWAENEITYLINLGIINGYPNGTFLPDHNITRAEAAKLIATELNLKGVPAAFPDVPSGYWATDYIGAAVTAGILTGYDNGKFEPDHNLSRAEMATILMRAYDLSGQPSTGFKDVSQGFWGYDAIQALKANGITNGYGDGTFHPNSNITRAEFSVMLARVLNDSFKQ